MKAVTGTDVQHAADLLMAGEIVAIPTETVYGLAANAFDPEAVLRIFTTKQRPSFDPLIVHIGRHEDLDRVVTRIPEAAHELIATFWPGPLTLVLPKTSKVPDVVTSGLDTVAARMPAHPITLDLLSRLPFPLAAPSANPFGYISPTTVEHVSAQLGNAIPYILDGGPCDVGVESTIIGWEEQSGSWLLYRHGGLPVERIEKITGPLENAVAGSMPAAPGMLASHYAPRKPLYVGNVEEMLARYADRTIGVIAFSNTYPVQHCKLLSPNGDMIEAARNLFAAMRELDAAACEVILAEVFPDQGLGRAINDRLRRAAVGR